MCFGLCCDFLYHSRCCFFKLLPLLWIADLALTIYIVIALYEADIFACCTTSVDPFSDECRYEDLGGASNVAVNDYGYCVREDNGIICDFVGECGELNGITSPDPNNELCSDKVLDDVASYNYFWLNAILITKCVGLVFLLLLECYTCCKKVDIKDKEAEEAEQTVRCLKCKQWGKACCVATFILLLKLIFIIFGTSYVFLSSSIYLYIYIYIRKFAK